jgi:P27 family predicted phage terminase small subunit
MGRRGPAPTPTPILKLRGSKRVTKACEAREIRGPAGRPQCPEWLDPAERLHWRRLVTYLDSMGVLTRIDGNALARYCRFFSRWRKAEEFIDKHGEMFPIKDEAGKVKCFQAWPQATLATKLAQQLTRLEQEFGMTPSSRTRIMSTAALGHRPIQSREKDRFFAAG